MMPVSILIPAYNPDQTLLDLVRDLLQTPIENIIVVNDGSDVSSAWVFDQLATFQKVEILKHATNLGKGAAIKTGLNFHYVHYPAQIGVVTADADGQHLVEDILKVADALQAHPESLIIGAREFKKEVPLRSRLGNILTRRLYRLIVGQSLTDTQSGLRGIPRQSILKFLKINANGYEFELDMLLSCRATHQSVIELTIQTVYINQNRSSHFNPLLDSLKIYFVLFRSMILSLATSVVDCIVFFIMTWLGFDILASQSLSRGVAVGFYYPLAKRKVFVHTHTGWSTFIKYLLLVIVSGSISYGIINFLVYEMGMNVALAKILSELTIYLGNFAVQRDFIFSKQYE